MPAKESPDAMSWPRTVCLVIRAAVYSSICASNIAAYSRRVSKAQNSELYMPNIRDVFAEVFHNEVLLVCKTTQVVFVDLYYSLKW